LKLKPRICTCLAIAGSLLYSDLARAQSGIRAGGRDVNFSDRIKKGKVKRPGAGTIDHREQMRRLVIKVSKFTRKVDKKFIVLTWGGLDLIEKVSGGEDNIGSVATTYMRAIDGVILRNVFFSPAKEGFATDKLERGKILRLAKFAQKRGLQIWVSDYAPTREIAQESHRLNKANGFIPFTVENKNDLFNSVPKYPIRPIFENAKNIMGLKSAQNFLYMTDSSRFASQEEMVERLSETNFDAVVVDVFHRGRNALTKKNVRKLQLKKIGSRRLVLTYMNIGFADTSRFYWKSGWGTGNPIFIGDPTPEDADRYFVQFWDRAWHEVITGTPNSYDYGITQQGFDGVILDGLENYKFFENREN